MAERKKMTWAEHKAYTEKKRELWKRGEDI